MRTITTSQAARVYALAEQTARQGGFMAAAEILATIPEGTRIVADPPAPPRKVQTPTTKRSNFAEDPYRPHLSAWYRPRFRPPAVIR